jgi:tellurite resistance protein TehA-like permease
VGISLMLTLIALIFYSATILPKLPYNTFIENVITSGFIFISAMILFAIINHNRLNAEPEKSDLRIVLKIAFPLIYLIIMGIITAFTFL